jgi:hypothetical protein
MIDQNGTRKRGVDLTYPAPDTNNCYWSTTFPCDSGTWLNSENTPPPALYAPPVPEVSPPKNPPPFFFWPIIRQVVFAIGITRSEQSVLIVYLKAKLDLVYKSAHVSFQGDTVVGVKFGPPKDPRLHYPESIGSTLDDIDTVINALLLMAPGLPKGETWTFRNPT